MYCTEWPGHWLRVWHSPFRCVFYSTVMYYTDDHLDADLGSDTHPSGVYSTIQWCTTQRMTWTQTYGLTLTLQVCIVQNSELHAKVEDCDVPHRARTGHIGRVQYLCFMFIFGGLGAVESMSKWSWYHPTDVTCVARDTSAETRITCDDLLAHHLACV